ncbi:phosphoribulokinase/uridine kinase [Montanilutibacter psychrotolerans]|uniref:phosphoribulokinase/uridine kinase n=1 Tax=Montanilutibacter psychrotolerans TaxID=1327343 RepID=UPI0011CE4ABE|nr:phosphoribulokinase/uridine kinase [Lysobacter psychrotolerans]
MAVTSARLWRDPVFRAGLALKLVLVVLLVPQIQQQWFVPFLQHAIANPSLDPWSGFLAAGGTPMAYPYGPVMLLVHLPGTLLGMLADWAAGTDALGAAGFRLGLLGADVATLYLLYRLFPEQPRKLLWLYWWSPIALYVTYWNGQTDIVPVALLLLSLLLIRQYRATASGVALGLALAAKFSMVLAVPFIGIYLWRNKRLRSLLRPFAIGCAAATLAVVPWLLSPGFVSMVFGTPESARVFDLALPLGPSLRLYLTPLLYLLAAYGVWRLRRISFDLLLAATGLSFFLVVLATPAPPGWYLWLVPFLVAHQLQGDRSARVLAGGFSVLLVGLRLVTSSGAALPLLQLDPGPALARAGTLMTPHAHSLGYTLIVATGLVLLVQMVRERVARNDYYRLGQKPVTVGIAGDSGSGKDTLSLALAGMFGEHSVVHVSGDDYHVWDRFAPMWKGLTHLNPRANDLQRFNNDVLALMDGKPIHCRQYDHVGGRFLPPSRLDRNDVVIASGLHALHMPRLYERFDASVFLDVDEDLRRAWKLHRDVNQRGHDREQVLKSLERRAVDARRHIHPQRAAASLVLRLMPVNASHLLTAASPDLARLKLLALIRQGTSHERMARILIGICGLHLDVQQVGETGDVEMIIEGDVAAEDIGLAARQLVPGLQEMLDIHPQWEGGMSGIMQLLVLIQIEESLKNRIR